MRVALIGDYSDRDDEGLKNVGKQLARALEDHCELQRFDILRASRPGLWRSLRGFRPHVVHSAYGNTLQALALVRLARTVTKAPVVVSVTHRGPSSPFREVRRLSRRAPLRLLRPDAALVQSDGLQASLQRLGWRTRLVPNGVDLKKFAPAGTEAAAAARAQWGVSPDASLVLHVGHVTRARNLGALRGLAEAGHTVLVVASTYQGVDQAVHDQLVKAGVRVHVGYVEELAALYSAADAYVFPVHVGETIETPLSVLEALACDTRVITVPHAGLKTFLDPGQGLVFAPPDEFVAGVEEALNGPCATRKKVEGLDWSAVATDVLAAYEGVLKTREASS